MSKKRVLVIGIDGATFKVIDPLVQDGSLPNIARIMDTGVKGVLNSTLPLVSPVAWTSFMTGKNPGKHQIFDFSGKIEGTYRFKMNSAKDRKATPFWMDLSKRNRRVFIIGVTMTYPPDPVNGYMVSGLGAPPDTSVRSYTYPTEFAKEMVNMFGQYRTVPEADLRKLSVSDSEKNKYIQGIFNQIDYRVNLFKYMWQKEKFDFSMVFFLDTDGISHYFWKYMDRSHKNYQKGIFSNVIHRVYEKIDEAIGELLETIDDDTDLVIVSDHGFGCLNRVIFLNNWLESEGYLTFKDDSFSNILSLRLKSLIKRRKYRLQKEIDWQKTKAFFSGTAGNIFINLKGRDPQGIVSIKEYDILCDEIRFNLLNLRDPETEERVVDRVYKKKELFADESIQRAPDLVLSFRRGFSIVGEEIRLHHLSDKGEIIVDSNNWSGIHEPEGVFLAYGKDIKKGEAVQGANIIDVAPTLLYLLDSKVPKSYDGRVLKDVFTPDFLKKNPVSYIKDEDESHIDSEVYNKDETERLRKQLRDLGYIE
ncbi:MAG: alkaline phosphatase family protein [Thermodesulfobacteriota bacterium]|nr:alkaline phosphatase family protein [Thermodesulfobacteriota bacterium]